MCNMTAASTGVCSKVRLPCLPLKAGATGSARTKATSTSGGAPIFLARADMKDLTWLLQAAGCCCKSSTSLQATGTVVKISCSLVNMMSLSGTLSDPS